MRLLNFYRMKTFETLIYVILLNLLKIKQMEIANIKKTDADGKVVEKRIEVSGWGLLITGMILSWVIPSIITITHVHKH